MEKNIEKDFLRAYEEHADDIYRFCSFRVSSKDLAKDLTQDTFIKTWKYIAEGNKVENFKAFLYRVAGNLIKDEFRRKKAESLDKLLEESPGLGITDTSEKTQADKFLIKETIETLKKLPEEERNLLTLRYVDDLDPREIAEILEISANYVSVKINRATASLREILINGKSNL